MFLQVSEHRITVVLPNDLAPVDSTIHVHKIEPPFRDRLTQLWKLTNDPKPKGLNSILLLETPIPPS